MLMDPHSPDTADCVDVIVVGAGIGGLATARTLIESGSSVVVLEARDRVGGRLLSRPVNTTNALDLGATWFWLGEERVEKLIRDLGVAVFAQHVAGDAIYHSPEGSKRMSGNAIDVPAGRFVAGAQALASTLAAELPHGALRLRQSVDRIEAAGSHLVAWMANAGIRARHVVLAVPPALVAERIAFAPPLPDHLAQLAAITPVWMGAITKVVARYHQPFWRDQGLAGAGISHYGPLREVHDLSGPNGDLAALFGFAAPSSAGDETATASDVLQQLSEMFGPKAGHPTDLIIHDWRREEWTSPPHVERLASYQAFGHRHFNKPALGGRLHWASTEAANESPGHIEGALAAAERAAETIKASLAITDT